MTAPTLSARHGREVAGLRVAPPPDRLAPRGWTALRRSVTVVVFVLATVAGVTLGCGGSKGDPGGRGGGGDR